MRPSELEFDISELKPLGMPYRKKFDMALTVSEKCYCSMNGQLLKQVKEIIPELEMNVLISEDLKVIVLQKSNEPNFKFRKSGIIKHQEFTKKLEEKGYAIPAKYIIEWSKEKNAWVGLLQEVTKAPSIKKGRRK